MKTVILIIVVVAFVTATNAAPLTTRCREILNSTGPYAYCDVTTNTSQGDDSLQNLVYMANNVTETFQLICRKEENKEEVSVCSCMSCIHCTCCVAALLTSLLPAVR